MISYDLDRLFNVVVDCRSLVVVEELSTGYYPLHVDVLLSTTTG